MPLDNYVPGMFVDAYEWLLTLLQIVEENALNCFGNSTKIFGLSTTGNSKFYYSKFNFIRL
jgi:hypothetical protein